MRKWRLLSLAIGLVAVLALGQFVAVGKKLAAADEPPRGEAPTGKGKRAQDFIAAFNRGDARAVAAFWMPDAEYTDQVGRQTRGREAIQKLYEKVFAARKGAKLNVIVTSTKLVAPDVAREEGINEVTPADGGPGTAAHFSAVLVKKDGEWYIESVHESVVHPPSNAEHFEDLEWLLGDWTGE